MKVLKFGGSSLSTPERILNVKWIVEQEQIGTIIVVSAFGGITDQLLKAAEQAKRNDPGFKNTFEEIKKRHLDTIEKVIPGKSQQEIVNRKVLNQLDELGGMLNGIFQLKDLTPKVMDVIVSFGERLSAFIMSEVVDTAYFSDARNLIRTDSHFGNAEVDFEYTNHHIQVHFEERNHYVFVPGFIAADEAGVTTTLGRGGSDYSAAIIAAALDVNVLEIWTDVDGFMTADPRMVDKAYAIDSLSYAEAMELSHFGAKVVYTPTIRPVYGKKIPVVIKNSFNPTAKGTTITVGQSRSVHPIKGISSINNVDLLTLQGAGLVGTKGLSMRLFGALARMGINVILITQASSEFSISFAIAPIDTERAQKAIHEEFLHEIEHRKEIRLVVEQELSVIAIVGEGMRHAPGIAGTLFGAMGRNGVNVVAIAQGSSELNISVVVRQDELKKALNVIHEDFFLSSSKEIHLFVMGLGNVGQELMKQIAQQREVLKEDYHLHLNITGVANSKKMLVREEGLNPVNYMKQLDESGEVMNHSDLLKKIKSLNLRNSVFVDCTANETVAGLYKDVLEGYSSVVTANKIACSSDYHTFKVLQDTARKRGMKFLYETNVGAGLPIIKTIDELMNSGDRILKIDAVLSGTLNYIFNVLSAEVSLSKAVQQAKELGYSEPDPRVDLSGVDVIRKIIILARQAGYELEMNDVKVDGFLPESCFKGEQDQFWKEIEKMDDEFEKKRKTLEAANKKWRFMASLDKGNASVGLAEVDVNHPAYNLQGSNNIIMLTTERYKDQPMIIKGYGAGADVTAAGVFADIIRIVNI